MFMRGNIDHLEQPEEYHKMAVPGKLKFLWDKTGCQRIPLPPPCQQLPGNTFTPTLSAVASEYLYPHPVSRAFLSFPRFWRTRERLHESSNIFIEHARHIARFTLIIPVISHPSHPCYHTFAFYFPFNAVYCLHFFPLSFCI